MKKVRDKMTPLTDEEKEMKDAILQAVYEQSLEYHLLMRGR